MSGRFSAALRLLVALSIASIVLIVLADAPPASAANAHNNWAGYHGVDDDGFTSGTGTMKVPQLACPATGTVDHAVDLGWVADSPFVGAGVRLLIHCAAGALTLSAEAAISDFPANPTVFINDVTAGDVLSGSFSYNPTTGRVRVRVTDRTSGESVVVNTVHASLKFTWSAFALDYVATFGPPPPVPTFTTMLIWGLTIDGAPVASKLVLDASDMYNGDHRLVRTLSLNPAGEGFRLKFVAST